ncbi:MAG: hypothetical protein ACKVOU_02900 [Cytophagales bacterium]
MEAMLIKVSSEAQQKALTAFVTAMEMEFEDIESIEEKIFGLMMKEADVHDLMNKEEKNAFLQTLGSGK